MLSIIRTEICVPAGITALAAAALGFGAGGGGRGANSIPRTAEIGYSFSIPSIPMNNTCCELALTRVPWTPPPCFSLKTSAWTRFTRTKTITKEDILVLISASLLLDNWQASRDLQVEQQKNLVLDLQEPGSQLRVQHLAHFLEVFLREHVSPSLNFEQPVRDLSDLLIRQRTIVLGIHSDKGDALIPKLR